ATRSTDVVGGSWQSCKWLSPAHLRLQFIPDDPEGFVVASVPEVGKSPRGRRERAPGISQNHVGPDIPTKVQLARPPLEGGQDQFVRIKIAHIKVVYPVAVAPEFVFQRTRGMLPLGKAGRVKQSAARDPAAPERPTHFRGIVRVFEGEQRTAMGDASEGPGPGGDQGLVPRRSADQHSKHTLADRSGDRNGT